MEQRFVPAWPLSVRGRRHRLTGSVEACSALVVPGQNNTAKRPWEIRGKKARVRPWTPWGADVVQIPVNFSMLAIFSGLRWNFELDSSLGIPYCQLTPSGILIFQQKGVW